MRSGDGFFRQSFERADQLDRAERRSPVRVRAQSRLPVREDRLRRDAGFRRRRRNSVSVSGGNPEVSDGVDRQHLLLLEGGFRAAGEFELSDAHLFLKDLVRVRLCYQGINYWLI